MRKLLLILGVASFVIGVWILLYDFNFIRRYDVDANDVLGATSDGSGVIDWETGTRPSYAYCPAWIYGVAFWLVAAVSLIVRAFLPHSRNASPCELPAPSS